MTDEATLYNNDIHNYGMCGEQLVWETSYDENDNYNLVIRGTGEMEDYGSWGSNVSPWGSWINTVTLKAGVTSVGACAFYNHDDLTSVTFGNTLTKIEENAFSECDSLDDIILSDSITKIDENAFYLCTGLKRINLGEGVTSIGAYAFSESGLKKITLPDSVKTIGEQSFANCASLRTVEMGYQLTEIGTQAFQNCTLLESVTMQDGVKTIQDYAFENCDSLPTILLSDSVTTIGIGVFKSCDSLTEIQVHAYNDAFVSQDGILYDASMKTLICCPKANSAETLTISSSVAEIDPYAFYECSNLTEVCFSVGLKRIYMCAFADCNKLTKMKLLGELPTIADDAFTGVVATMEYTNVVTNVPASDAYGGTITWVLSS